MTPPDTTRCASCGHGNRPERRFCTECGARLGRACGACGAAAEAGEKFCGACGAPLGAEPPPRDAPSPRTYTPRHLAEKILGSRAALEGERKQVTVLFADVKGSMELAGRVDPEEWHHILDRFFHVLTDGVHRFEGTVNQYTGDGIMALFGAPVAHEDHAQRACYAALALRDALRPYARELKRERGFDFAVRMGINSGEVVVGRIGDDLRMDYTAQGHTVGLAARMEELASAGAIYVTGGTADLVSGYFDLEDLGPFNVKGVGERVRVFELRGAGPLRTRFDVSRARGLTRFVGRDADLRTLEECLERVHQGNGQVVGVVGEAGLGKSRLCFEFVERCRSRGLRVLEGQAVAHGRNVPLLPMLQIFRAYFGIGEPDGERTAREKIAGRLLLIDESFREVLPLVFDLLGVPDPDRPGPPLDPEARQRQAFGVLRRLVQATREPIVALLEDLHWLDAASESWLAQWVDAIAGARGFLLVNFRPEYHAPWMQRSHYRQIPLSPLGPEATRDLLIDLLGADASTAGLVAAIHERTAGNPFFVEEIIQTLIEAGHLRGSRGTYRLVTPVERLEVPPTVQALLAARIDRLPEYPKRVLETAAVIGKEFAAPLLEAVADVTGDDLAAALAALGSAEFVYEQALYPTAEYTFKHPLTQEVAYRSQLAERRSRVHAAVARAIAARHADRLDERAALLAHHWESAGEALEAARWHRRAAEWVGSGDAGVACAHWRRVLGSLAALPESPEVMTLGLVARVNLLNFGWRLGVAEDEAARLFAEAKALAERSGDTALLARLITVYATVRGTAGEVAEYLAHALEAARLAEHTDDLSLRFVLRYSQVYPHFLVGNLRQALALCDQALEDIASHPDTDTGLAFSSRPDVFFPWFRAMVLFQLGRVADALLSLDRAAALARAHGATEILGWAHFSYALSAESAGNLEGALQHARQSLEIAEKIGSTFSRAAACVALGRVHNSRGEWDAALAAFEQALALIRERRTSAEQEAGVLAGLADAHLGRGDRAQARRTAEHAVAVARQRGTRVQEISAQLALARVVLQASGIGEREAVEAALARAQALVEHTDARSLAPSLHLARAELARLGGDEAGHRHALETAERLAAAMGMTTRAKPIEHEAAPELA
jgi:class 3 adenylate cyclase/tetratricopeptide (TPR) repeat protein